MVLYVIIYKNEKIVNFSINGLNQALKDAIILQKVFNIYIVLPISRFFIAG